MYTVIRNINTDPGSGSYLGAGAFYTTSIRTAPIPYFPVIAGCLSSCFLLGVLVVLV